MAKMEKFTGRVSRSIGQYLVTGVIGFKIFGKVFTVDQWFSVR